MSLIKLPFLNHFASKNSKLCKAVKHLKSGSTKECLFIHTGNLTSKLIIRKGNTKGKLATRTIPIIDDLRILLTNYHPGWKEVYLFPGRFGSHLDPDSADKILRKAIKRVGFIGVSSHSFRRTALTMMSDNGTPLRVIQEVSGHRNLEQLQAYIEVRNEQVLGAVTGLSMLSPVTDTGKYTFYGMFSSLSLVAINRDYSQ